MDHHLTPTTHHNDTTSGAYSDDSLDPIQDIFQQFENNLAHSDSYSYSTESDLGDNSTGTAPGAAGTAGSSGATGSGGAGQDYAYSPDFMSYLDHTSGGSTNTAGEYGTIYAQHQSQQQPPSNGSSTSASSPQQQAYLYNQHQQAQAMYHPLDPYTISPSQHAFPPSSTSLSPPSSTSSFGHSPPHQQPQPQSYVHNETLARMIVEAQANQHQQAMYTAPSSYNMAGVVPGETFDPSFRDQSQAQGQGQKKRRLAPSPSRPSSNPIEQVPSIARKNRRPSATASNAKTSEPMDLDPDMRDFNFAMGGGAEINRQVPRTSVDLIANAGIPAGRVYRDTNPNKVPIARVTTAPIAPAPVATMMANEKEKKKTTVPKVEKGKKVIAMGEKRKKGEKGHNAVERRYRNNINNAIATLRDIVPALRHLKPLPSMPASRRRASQFTLSTSSQAPTPSGLIDGIPAAKTLSKGTILGKSIEYITFLQEAREDAKEDVEIFKGVVMEMVAGGGKLIEEFEKKRAVKEGEREERRERERREQERLDEEDEESESEGEEEVKEEEVSEEKDKRTKRKKKVAGAKESNGHLDGVAQLRQQLSSTTTPYQHPSTVGVGYDTYLPQQQQQSQPTVSPTGFPPSPVSSSDEPNHLMYNPQHARAPPRILLAAFMGLSFAGGFGYDWTYGMQEDVGEAWSGQLVKRAAQGELGGVANSAVVTGLVFLGLASILATLAFILYPMFSPRPKKVAMGGLGETKKDESQSRTFYRQRRRAAALAMLARINDSSSQEVPSYIEECKAALKARKELLKLVGAPTYGLLPALAKEALATALRNVTTIRVGSFSTWKEADRVEAAVAWVRIAEIEATVAGASEIHYLARWYTFLRLFNLSRSTHWPSTTSSISRPAVNAVLALHLNSLGQPLSANALWNKATKSDRKKCDITLDSWVEVALSTDFDQVRTIVGSVKDLLDVPSPSDTVPLLKISEARCETELRETWAKIFLAVVQSTTYPPNASLSGIARFATFVDQPRLEESVEHILASTAQGATVHTLAKVTQALCVFYTGHTEQAQAMARVLAKEAKSDGPMARLACATPFFTLLLEDSSIVEPLEPSSDVDILAATTLGWLTVRRQSLQLLAGGPNEMSKVDPILHAKTLAVRRLLGSSVFNDLGPHCVVRFAGGNARSGRFVA